MQPHGLIETFDFLDDSLTAVIASSQQEAELSVAHHYLASVHTLAGLAAGGTLTKADDTAVVQAMLNNARRANQCAVQRNWHQVLTHARAALVSMPEGDPGWLPTEIPDVPAFASPDVQASSPQTDGVKIVWVPPSYSAGAGAIPAAVSAMPGEGGYMPPTPLEVPR